MERALGNERAGVVAQRLVVAIVRLFHLLIPFPICVENGPNDDRAASEVPHSYPYCGTRSCASRTHAFCANRTGVGVRSQNDSDSSQIPNVSRQQKLDGLSKTILVRELAGRPLEIRGQKVKDNERSIFSWLGFNLATSWRIPFDLPSINYANQFG